MSVAFLFNKGQPPRVFACIFVAKTSVRSVTTHQPRKFCGWILFLYRKGTNFMLAQVIQVVHTNGIYFARKKQSGRLSQISFYNDCASCTSTGNPDNEYKQQLLQSYGRKRHRYRFSKKAWALHCPYPWAEDRLHTLVPDP